ncbi:hypothetical protein [Paenibacillus sp.]|uniref:hypothetical protein n=1 Tax=Paenibacillus sp. TaxID=58172 RepID=UPI002D440A39|nr:hypothetical protein [Paenibacillus sp.]HZG87295.1 hypothetical protein [Paenibacillus sp.]
MVSKRKGNVVSTVYLRLERLWDQHRRDPQQIRNKLAQEFIDALYAEGFDFKRMQREKMKHPQIRRKDKRPIFTVLDILADFIINAEMIPERSAEYPVANAEASFEGEQRRKEREFPYDETSATLGIDGRDYRSQKRRERSHTEGNFVDENAKIRNYERRRRYEAFKRGEAPGVLRVDIESGEKFFSEAPYFLPAEIPCISREGDRLSCANSRSSLETRSAFG